MSANNSISADLAGTDIYIIDQILRGNITPSMRVLDAGCGGGRNIRYLLKTGYRVFGLDPNAVAIAATRDLALSSNSGAQRDDFRVESLESNTFPDESVDVLLCNAVLHFASDPAHFEAMLRGAWRVLAPGGLFFARLASSIGIEALLSGPTPGWHNLPDGTQRFLVDAGYLKAKATELDAFWVDPLKSTVVDGQRSMTTWVLRK